MKNIHDILIILPDSTYGCYGHKKVNSIISILRQRKKKFSKVDSIWDVERGPYDDHTHSFSMFALVLCCCYRYRNNSKTSDVNKLCGYPVFTLKTLPP